jgi:hypothetical protein
MHIPGTEKYNYYRIINNDQVKKVNRITEKTSKMHAILPKKGILNILKYDENDKIYNVYYLIKNGTLKKISKVEYVNYLSGKTTL